MSAQDPSAARGRDLQPLPEGLVSGQAGPIGLAARPSSNEPVAAVPRRLEVLDRGRPVQAECLEIDGHLYRIERGWLDVVRLEDEWYDDVPDPHRVLQALHDCRVRADLFTFRQRLPDTNPWYHFFLEQERWAVLPARSHAQWWQECIRPRVRGQIRKALQAGVTLRESAFDDEFVRGMTRIFNESPVRQNRPFWHYGKDEETVRRQFSRFLFRERLVGAYHEGEMIGFMMLGDAGGFALTGQILASLHHRDKSPSLLLVNRAVALCETHGLGPLVYYHWTDDSLGEFKRRCGFEPVALPRYHVPLSARGRWALRTGLHRGWQQALPPRINKALRQVRGRWYGWRSPHAAETGATAADRRAG